MTDQERIVSLEKRIAMLEGRLAALEARDRMFGPTQPITPNYPWLRQPICYATGVTNG